MNRGVIRYYNGIDWTYVEGELVDDLPKKGEIWIRKFSYMRVEIARDVWSRAGGEAMVSYYELDADGKRTGAYWHKRADGEFVPVEVERTVKDFHGHWHKEGTLA